MTPLFRMHDVLGAEPGQAFSLADEADLLAPLAELIGPENAWHVLRAVGAWGMRDLPSKELAEETGLPESLTRRVVAACDVGRILARHKVPRIEDTSALAAVLPPELFLPGVRTTLAVALGSLKEPLAGVLVGREPRFRLEPGGLFRRLVQLRAESFGFVDVRWSRTEEEASPEKFAGELAEAGKLVGVPLAMYLLVDSYGPRAVPVPALAPDS
jgi:hypothetical protein